MGKNIISILSFLIMLVSFPTFIYCQKLGKLSEYTASNGVTYKAGDTISLSAIDYNEYKHIRFPAILQSGGSCCPDASYGSKSYIVKKIKRTQFSLGPTGKKVELFLYGSIIVDIEAALRACEVECVKTVKMEIVNDNKNSKYDELLKLKELLDLGAITEEEYKSEKAKILKKK